MDELDDGHISRTPMIVDKEGWEETSKLIDETLDKLLEIQSGSSERLASSKEKGILSKVEMLHFMSPDSEEAEAEAKKAASAAANGR